MASCFRPQKFYLGKYRITWHQQLRRVINAPGILLLSVTPFSFAASNTRIARILKRYFLLFSAFAFSALIHMAGTHAVTRTMHLPALQGGEIIFYPLQAVIIAFEDFVCWLLNVDDKRNPPSARMRTLGYLITATWYLSTQMRFKAMTLPMAHGVMDERGPQFAAVELLKQNADAVPGNFVKTAARMIEGREAPSLSLFGI